MRVYNDGSTRVFLTTLFDKSGQKRYHNNEDTEQIFQNYKMVLREITLNKPFTLHPPGDVKTP